MRSDTIAGYVDALSAALSFDRRLARRVRLEVEDHLREAAAPLDGVDAAVAERSALERFGDPRQLASEYAAASVQAHMQRTGVSTLLALFGIFVAMRGRLIWYDLSGMTDPNRMARLAPWIALDVTAFRIAACIGVAAVLYVGTRRTFSVLDTLDRKHVMRSVAMLGAAAVPLQISVTMDAIFTGLRFAHGAAHATLPVLSLLLEFALMGALIRYVWTAARRIRDASTILNA